MSGIKQTQFLKHGAVTVKTHSVKILNVREHERTEASL